MRPNGERALSAKLVTKAETIAVRRCYKSVHVTFEVIAIRISSRFKRLSATSTRGDNKTRLMRLFARAFVLGFLVFTLLIPGKREAQTVPSVYQFLEKAQEAGPFVGRVTLSTGRFGYGPKGGLIFGGRYGVHVSGPISLEGAIGVVEGERDIISPGRDEGDRVIGSAEVMMAKVDASLRFSLTGHRTWHGLSPSLIFGGGITFDTAERSPTEETLVAADRFELGKSFVGSLGLSTHWYLSNSIALRGDGLFFLSRLGTPPGFSDEARGFEGVEKGEWVQGLGFTVTAVFRW